MILRRLVIILVFIIIPVAFTLASTLANEKSKDTISITLFKAHNDFSQSDTFKAKQRIIFYVLWDIPEDVTLKGKAILTVEGERVDGKEWSINEKKDLSHKFRSHYWGWDCHQKIPKSAKPGSVGTATVKLKIEGYESVEKTLSFNIEK